MPGLFPAYHQLLPCEGTGRAKRAAPQTERLSSSGSRRQVHRGTSCSREEVLQNSTIVKTGLILQRNAAVPHRTHTPAAPFAQGIFLGSFQVRGGIGKIPFPTQQRHVHIQVTWWHGWHPGASDEVPESQKLNYGAITKRDFAHFCNIEEKKSSILVKTEQLCFHHAGSLT